MLDKDFQKEALEMVGRKELDLQQNDLELENDASVEYDEEDDYDDEVEVNDDEEDGGVEVAVAQCMEAVESTEVRKSTRNSTYKSTAAARTGCG